MWARVFNIKLCVPSFHGCVFRLPAALKPSMVQADCTVPPHLAFVFAPTHLCTQPTLALQEPGNETYKKALEMCKKVRG